MDPKTLILTAALTLVSVVGLGGTGNAVPITQSYLLDQSNELADGVSYGLLDITADTATGTVQFELDALTDTDVGNGIEEEDNFGIQNFGFNTILAGGSISAGDFSLPSGWSVSIGSNSMDGFGKFEFKISGTGSSRQDPLVFTISNLGADAVIANFLELSTNTAGQGNQFFAAHVAGFEYEDEDSDHPHFESLSGEFEHGDDDITSHFIGGSTEIQPVSVPEPSAWILTLAGLCGLAIILRWRLQPSRAGVKPSARDSR